MLVILSLVVQNEGICFHAYPQVEGANHVVLFDFIGGFFSILDTLFYCLVIGDRTRYGRVIVDGCQTFKSSANHGNKACPCRCLKFGQDGIIRIRINIKCCIQASLKVLLLPGHVV